MSSKLGVAAAAAAGCRLRDASSRAVASLPRCWAADISSRVGMSLFGPFNWSGLMVALPS